MIQEDEPKPYYNEYLESIYVSDEMRDFIEPLLYSIAFKAVEIGVQKSRMMVETQKDINRLRA